MAPRPAFLSSLGSKDRTTPTGLKPPPQMDRDRELRQIPSTSRPEFLSDLVSTPATYYSSSPISLLELSGGQDSPRGGFPGGFNIIQVDSGFGRAPDQGGVDNLPGSVAFGGANPGGMPGVGIAQQFLGRDTYNQAIAAGMTPDQINTQLQKALAEGRGINVEKFQKDLDKFQQFQESDFAKGLSNKLPVIDGENVFSVSPLQITANPAEGVMGLVSGLAGPFVDMIGDVAGAAAEGRTGIMNIIRNLGQGKGNLPSFGAIFNPGDIAARLNAAGPEAKRIYAQKLSQGVPYQQAFEEATGEKFATGGIATLQ